MMAREVGRHYEAAPTDFAMPEIRALLSGSDLILANLESPVATGGRPDPAQNPHVTFRAAPETLDVLRGIGVNVVALGNNHALDYGDDALAETLEHLDAAGIRHVGAGRSYEEANAPLLLDLRERRVAVLSYAFIYSVNTRMATRSRPGVADHRINRILPRIRDLTASGYDVIVTVHWGFEYHFYPLPYQMRQARRMIDAGARMVLGHGPHFPQGIELYQGREIVYSLGNFIFDEPFKFANRSFIYTAEIDASGNTQNRSIVPVHLLRHVPHVVDGAQKRQLEGLVTTLGVRYQRAGTGFWGNHSASYLADISRRAVRGRSVKYLRVPPLSFYRDVSPSAVLRRLRPSTIISMARSLRGRRTRP
jgi:poly-gamma-glutamate capsule biosynthesis protein CapA/YwtB (metallophosphatase superfamily)